MFYSQQYFEEKSVAISSGTEGMHQTKISIDINVKIIGTGF